LKASTSFTTKPARRFVVRASAEDPDAELEKRLEKLRLAKGATPYGQGAKATEGKPPSKPADAPKKAAAEKKEYDFTGETVYYQGPPHRGDLAVNLALGATLLWLPLTIAAVGRAAFVNYKFTDKRLSVSTNAPWKTEQTDVAYQEVKEVVTVGRGVGLWGDMVVTLRDNSKVELRSLDKFVELKDYILARRDALAPKGDDGMLDAATLMGEEAVAGGKKGSKKGFA